MSDRKSKLGFGIMLGSLVGILTGLFLSDKPGKNLREKSLIEYHKIRKILEEKNADQAVRKIFGKLSDDSSAIFNQTKDRLAKGLAELKQDLDTIDQTKYHKLVKDVTNKIKTEKKLPDDVLSKLSKYLESDFTKLKTGSKQKKIIKKIVKKSINKPTKKTRVTKSKKS